MCMPGKLSQFLSVALLFTPVNTLLVGNTSAAQSEYIEGSPCTTFPTLAPTLCPQGNAIWSMQELRAHIPGFANAYKHRPILDNEGGVRVNHGFALWVTVNQLKPKYIIESGVFKGGSTWLMRQAAGPGTSIYSFDPAPSSQLLYKEDHSLPRFPGKYFMGPGFRDLGQMNWDALIPRSERKRTLVFLDDHMAATRRTKELLKAGFVHVFYEDNFARKESDLRPAGCYSFNQMCSPVPMFTKSVPFQDNFGKTHESITLAQHNANVNYIKKHIEVYFEFPALYDSCRPSDEALITKMKLLGLGFTLHDALGTQHPPYVRLKA